MYGCSLTVPKEVEVKYEEIPEKVDFNYDVKPILSDRCYSCHGPDEKSRRAGLRLDQEKTAFMKLSSGRTAIDPGSISGSEMAHRILSDDPDEVMPTPESNLSLTNTEKAILLKWIEQGAEWKEHWSFLPIQGVSSSSSDQYKNPIDYFISKKLKTNGLEFSPISSKEKLIRRLYFDLTGLPPSIDEVESFVNTNDKNAYLKVVNRLLDSDEHAERLTMDWLDVSRYADSHGLHADGIRTMWPWRDWVIKAFKDNIPYDEFVSVQLSGDMRENATKEEKLATAFNRNNPMTAEGGVIDEEWRLNYVFDRTETLGTAVMGLTLMCAKCHDHKFDPISQKDYYQLSAFFNQTREIGMTGDDGDFGPLLFLPDQKTEKKLNKLELAIDVKEKELNSKNSELNNFYNYAYKLSNFESSVVPNKNVIEKVSFDKISKQKVISDDKTVIVQGSFGRETDYIIDNSRDITSYTNQKLKKGLKGNALEFDGSNQVFVEKVPNFEWTDPFSGAFWFKTTKRKKGFTQSLLTTTGGKNSWWRGWDLILDDKNYLNLRLISSLPGDAIHVKSVDSLKVNNWHHIAFSYDGSGNSSGINLFLNGEKINKKVVFDNLKKSILPVSSSGIYLQEQALKIGASGDFSSGDNGWVEGLMDELFIFNKSISSYELKNLYNTYDIDEKLLDDAEKVEHLVYNDISTKKIKNQIKNLKKQWLKNISDVKTVMVMEEMKDKRKTFLYDRGSYQSPSYEVEADVPSKLPKMSAEMPKNRLGLSKWIFDKKNPLTSRVAVNRYWQMIFGRGIVNTPGDFGVQGQLPSHPNLLEYLSNYFMEKDWDIRDLLRLMVTSHSYMQSSKPSQKQVEIDPDNILLSRSNSYRLPAEMIRDNALAASGLLVKHVGGKSVKPYQPRGLWKEKSNFSIKLLNYKESTGDSLYRRSMYTFIRRTNPPPSMSTFDAPTREVCTVKREITNTPLQALVLLNDPQFVEASRILAERIQKEKPSSIDESIKHGFRLCTSRKPRDKEIQLLKNLYDEQLKKFKQNPKLAYNIFKNGKKPRDKTLNLYKTAALSMVANVMLNHDEVYMKR
tara:strand:- start:2470 stop:5685 length:3216 start_codon:yes stop_codon:yes gene_type:complete